ncbi:hypothetical protein A2W24_01425 [Microgenomates group bacterium RBG_16_45_19]|nr:MAG: hypothetical protein A2W24_01425 [Microgenomates group bacterium RBG_16_45_19]
MRLIGWTVEEKNGLKAYARKLPLLPVGVIKIQRVPVKQLNREWIEGLVKKHRAVACHIEIDERVRAGVNQASPTTEFAKRLEPVIKTMKAWGYKPEKLGMLASKTQVIDLKLSQAKLLKQMKSKTRYNLGLAQRRGLTARVVNGQELLVNEGWLVDFLKLIRDNYRRVNFWGGTESWLKAHLKAFGKEAYLVMVDGEDQLVAAALFMTADGISYYSHNGSTAVGRRLMGPTLAVWTGMVEAKRRRLQTLDFDGVYDERFPVKRWLGYTRFKAGFGGDYVWYPPALVKWLPGIF